MEMQSLTFDRSREEWSTSTGLVKERIPVPRLSSLSSGPDRSNVIIKVHYAGFCGSDRGIWWRKAFGDMILGSLDRQNQDKRVVGHELLGEIVELGDRARDKYRLKVGDMVSTESHIVCGTCYQCRMGDSHVCAKDEIIGISVDGCFAEYIKLPAKALWPTNLAKIRPEVAAIQEPFGNAVHACQVTDLRGKTVVVVGCGTIGLFAVLIARGMGAAKVIGVEVNPHHVELARQLGCDEVIVPALPPPEIPWASDPELRQKILELTDGVAADVVLEMAGFNSSMNNALKCVRRGGNVVAFGVKNGNAIIEDMHRLVMDGIQVQGVVGRRIFQTWEMTRHLLENRSNGIQDAIWDVILNRGEGTLVHIDEWEKHRFEETIRSNPKAVIQFS